MKNGYFLAGILMVAASLLASAMLYPGLPDRIPTHWNAQGQVDHYGPPWTILILPAVMAAILVSFSILPWLSPRRFEVDTFRSTYLYIMVTIVGLTGYFHALTLWAAVKSPVNMSRALTGGVFVFLILFGNVLGKVRRNFWIGVRTPWCLADERVWNATHRFSARLFVGAGILGLAAILAGLPMAAPIAIIAVAVLIAAIYSLVYYKRLQRRNEV